MKLSTTIRANKKDAFQMLIDLKKGQELTPIELDSLILFFAPPVPKTPKTPEQWVSLAVAKKDGRHYLCYMHVENGYAYGSDGHRIHKAKTDFEDGFYAPKTLMKVDDQGKFPDVERILSAQKRELVDIETAPTLSEGEFYFSTDKTMKCQEKQYAIGINKKYLEDATSNKTTELTYSGANFYGEVTFGEFCISGARIGVINT